MGNSINLQNIVSDIWGIFINGKLFLISSLLFLLVAKVYVVYFWARYAGIFGDPENCIWLFEGDFFGSCVHAKNNRYYNKKC